jgi:hypothetical protein
VCCCGPAHKRPASRVVSCRTSFALPSVHLSWLLGGRPKRSPTVRPVPKSLKIWCHRRVSNSGPSDYKSHRLLGAAHRRARPTPWITHRTERRHAFAERRSLQPESLRGQWPQQCRSGHDFQTERCHRRTDSGHRFVISFRQDTGRLHDVLSPQRTRCLDRASTMLDIAYYSVWRSIRDDISWRTAITLKLHFPRRKLQNRTMSRP